MKLTKQQLEMQEAILLAVHKGCTLEEARKKESNINGCIIQFGEKREGHKFNNMLITSGSILYSDIYEDILYIDGDEYSFNTIGLPPTLSRVLTALGNYCYADGAIYSTDGGGWIREYVCDRKLLNDNNTDRDLFQQSKETWDIIYSVLIKK